MYSSAILEVSLLWKRTYRHRLCNKSKEGVLPSKKKGQQFKETEWLLKEDIIASVKYAEWAAPIVPVQNLDGSVRICDLLNTQAGWKQFSELDLSHAYQKNVINDKSKSYPTVWPVLYNRLAFKV